MKKTFTISSKFFIFCTLCTLFAANSSFLNNNCYCQSITWQRTYDDSAHSEDGAYTVCPADGNNIYIAGFAGFIPTYGYVIKINAFGDTLWQKKISQIPMILASVPLSDGSCVFTGYSNTIYAARILPNGQIAWLNHYGGHSSSSIIRTLDNGFIGCGDGGNLDSYIYRLDSNGALIWQKYYNFTYRPDFTTIILSSTNGFIVCGSVGDSPTDSGKGYIANVDDIGNIVWAKQYYGKSRSFDKIKTINSGYLIAGSKFDTAGSGYIRSFIMKTDLNGNQTFFKEFNTSADEYTSDLMFINNNKYVLVLKRDSAIWFNTRILTLDSTFNITNQKIIIDNRGATSLSCIIAAPNSTSGDYVLAGYTTITSVQDDFYAARIDSSLTNLPPFGIQRINSSVPVAWTLAQNYPNPFNPSTRISFQILKQSNIRISLFDISGKLLRNIITKNQTAGTYILDIDCSEFASGIYFCSLYADGTFINTIKMILLK